MNKVLKIGVFFFLTCLLVLVRFLEEDLFYDPLVSFFKSDYASQALPELNELKILLHVFFRFLVNTLISLAMLWVVFKDKGVIKFSCLLYGILFLLLFIPFCYFIFKENTQNYLTLFYVRRFLIQPLFLLILLPAFYFQKSKN